MGRRPVEPPVGTVLQTCDSIDEYRIERVAEGWVIQYRDGENEFGLRVTGNPISWRAAWSAWGPPAGAQPFSPVPVDAAPLPPYPPEPPPAWVGLGPDATDQQVDMPPAAAPYQPPSCTTSPGPSPAPTSNGGTSMTASVGDVKSNIARANGTTRDAIAILGQALNTLSESRSQLAAAVAGSPHADVGAALNALNAAGEKIREAQQAVAGSIQSSEDVAARL